MTPKRTAPRPSADGPRTSTRTLPSKASGCGAIVAGRRLFDLTDGWGDNHPAGAPVVVVTHRPPPEDAADRFPRTTFTGSVEDGIAEAKRIAHGGSVPAAGEADEPLRLTHGGRVVAVARRRDAAIRPEVVMAEPPRP